MQKTDSGYFLVYRKVWRNKVFRNLIESSVWLYMISSATHQDKTLNFLDNRILTTDSTNLILQDIIGVSSAGAITGVSTFDATTLTENSVRVATQPFAIAQAVALG